MRPALRFSLAPMLALFVSVLGCCVVGCGETAPAGAVAYVRTTIGPEGGAIALRGCALAIPAGALSTPTTLTLSELVISPPAGAVSPLFAIEPQELELERAAVLTLPVTRSARSTRAMRLEAGTGAPLDDPRAGSLFVEGTVTRLGRFYAEGLASTLDAGLDDASVRDAARDAPFVRPDTAPLPRAPVVVGDDLRPADYACRRMWTHAPLGEATMREVQLRARQTREPLAGATLDRFDAPAVPSIDECADGCTSVTVDAEGLATITLPAGVLGYRIAPDLALGRWARTLLPAVPTPPEGSPLVLEAATLTQLQTVSVALGAFMGSGGQVWASIVDCNGDRVQRAVVRAFDDAGFELFPTDPSGFRSAYGNGTDAPRPSAERSAADGAYFAATARPDLTTLRLEVWGATTLGGELELLGCEQVPVAFDGLTVVQLPPLRSDAPAVCR